MSNKSQRIETQLVHSGACKLGEQGFAATPIIQSSTFFRKKVTEELSFEYSRTKNPTRSALEESIAVLEKGSHCCCYSSGVAAIHAAASILQQGDEVICYNRAYSGTIRIFKFLEFNYGIKVHLINFGEIESVLALINSDTKMIWLETPSNPLLEVLDLSKIAAVVRRKEADFDSKIVLIADNTFATPYFQNPLRHGMDMVVHSASKYLGGHSDAILGAVICDDLEIYQRLKFIQNAFGSIPSPMESFLILRGIKTLHLRMQTHERNALTINKFLEQHSKVQRVYFPNEPEDKAIAKQMTGKGGVVSFTLKSNTKENAAKFLNHLSLIKIAESLGGVESLATAPALISQKKLTLQERNQIGIKDSLVRLSVGVEDINDLIQDIENALKFCQ